MATTYRTQSMDTWDVISKRVYGSELFMDKLIEANILLRKVVFFSAGVEITCPDIETKSSEFEQNLPPWKRGQTNE